MKAGLFDLRIARTADEAVAMLGEADGGGKVLAGGQSLVPLMAFRLARPETVVDINGLHELSFVRGDGSGGLRIGALTRHRELEGSAAVAAGCPLVAEAMPMIAHAPIRNRGTIGGSLAHADPAAELPMVCLTLDAALTVRGPGGDRQVAAADFFDGPFMTALADDELLTEIAVPAVPAGAGCAVLELSRRRGDFATVAVSAVLGVGAGGEVTSARLGYASMGPTPVRARAAEAELVGAPAGPDAFRRAAQAARAELRPRSDLHASADFRGHLAEVLTRRVLAAAFARAERGATP